LQNQLNEMRAQVVVMQRQVDSSRELFRANINSQVLIPTLEAAGALLLASRLQPPPNLSNFQEACWKWEQALKQSELLLPMVVTDELRSLVNLYRVAFAAYASGTNTIEETDQVRIGTIRDLNALARQELFAGPQYTR